MAAIQPNPSQAAVIMQRYFKEQGVELKLSQVQEALARSRGYTSFQTLQADVDLRKASSLVQTGDTDDSFWKDPSRDGLELHSITGRRCGDDDDTNYLIWARPNDSATEMFKQRILEDEYVEDDDDDDESRKVFITGEEKVGSVVNGRFVLCTGVLPV